MLTETNSNLITLYHNTSNENAIKIAKEGIKCGLRLHAYGKGSEAEGAGVWCTKERGYGYGGATITFQIPENDDAIWVANDTEYVIYRDIKPDEIVDIDLMISDIPSNKMRKDSINSTVESDIPVAISDWGKADVLRVLGDNPTHFIPPYNKEQLLHLIETGEKYCKGKIELVENKVVHINKNKLEEVSRNELLAKSKQQTITRYNKSAGYKGFSIVDIDTTSVLSTDSLRVTCRVGDYFDTVEVEDILYWVQFYAEQNETNQINSKVVTQAIMDAIDAMTIKVDCNCGDFKYRFAYLATKMGYKYGKPENRPAKITNPNDYGAMCKHLISMLSNKKWLQQVTGTFMDFLEKRIEEVNRYLRVRKGEELTLPNELARQNAKKGFYSKLFKDIDEEEDNNDNVHNNDIGTTGGSDNTNDTETNSDTNMDDVHDNKNNVEDKVDTDDSNNISNSDIESEDESNE